MITGRTDGRTDRETDRQSATQYAASSLGGGRILRDIFKGPHNNQKMLSPGAIFERKYTNMRLRLGLHPGNHWGSLQRSPDPLASFQGAALWLKKEGEGEGRVGSVSLVLFHNLTTEYIEQTSLTAAKWHSM